MKNRKERMKDKDNKRRDEKKTRRLMRLEQQLATLAARVEQLEQG